MTQYRYFREGSTPCHFCIAFGHIQLFADSGPSVKGCNLRLQDNLHRDDIQLFSGLNQEDTNRYEYRLQL